MPKTIITINTIRDMRFDSASSDLLLLTVKYRITFATIMALIMIIFNMMLYLITDGVFLFKKNDLTLLITIFPIVIMIKSVNILFDFYSF